MQVMAECYFNENITVACMRSGSSFSPQNLQICFCFDYPFSPDVTYVCWRYVGREHGAPCLLPPYVPSTNIGDIWWERVIKTKTNLTTLWTKGAPCMRSCTKEEYSGTDVKLKRFKFESLMHVIIKHSTMEIG